MKISKPTRKFSRRISLQIKLQEVVSAQYAMVTMKKIIEEVFEAE